MMNAVETINAAAAAMVAAEPRGPLTATVQKRRWGSCWSLIRCFGHRRTSKRIGHAVLVPEPALPLPLPPPAAPDPLPPTAAVVPFIAPPSSPASLLQSDPPSIVHSPTKLLSLASVRTAAATAFAVGPYTYEMQLVSPPVFSTFTTEPSTAAYTPPPESGHQTTMPSSPDVPFAQLLASSLEQARKNGVPYQFYYPKRKWGSRLGSGSLTPDGAGLRSRLGSGSLTPCQETFPIDKRMIAAAAGPASDGPRSDEDLALIGHHRVSFELTGEDVARCLESKSSAASFRDMLEFPNNEAQKGFMENHRRSAKEFNFANTGGDSITDAGAGTGSDWWADGKASARDSKNRNNWSFFPFLGPQVS